MKYYLLQAAYATDEWRSMLDKPRNPAEILTGALKKMGGEVLTSWMCSGAYDLVMILHLPDEFDALAAEMALKAGCGVRTATYTRLFSWQEAMRAMEQAAEMEVRTSS